MEWEGTVASMDLTNSPMLNLFFKKISCWIASQRKYNSFITFTAVNKAAIFVFYKRVLLLFFFYYFLKYVHFFSNYFFYKFQMPLPSSHFFQIAYYETVSLASRCSFMDYYATIEASMAPSWCSFTYCLPKIR